MITATEARDLYEANLSSVQYQLEAISQAIEFHCRNCNTSVNYVLNCNKETFDLITADLISKGYQVLGNTGSTEINISW